MFETYARPDEHVPPQAGILRLQGVPVRVDLNRMLQAGREPHVAMHCALEPYTELELFRAYRVYYEQLQREIPAPCMDDIVWPDQCDPRFPLENDPRAAHYGMWVYSGGLSYGGKTS